MPETAGPIDRRGCAMHTHAHAHAHDTTRLDGNSTPIPLSDYYDKRGQ